MAEEEISYPSGCRLSRVLNILSIGAWATAVLAGMIWLQQYSLTEGKSGSVPSLKSFTRLPTDPGKANLLIFIHPQCPCTRASLRELERLMTRAGDRLAVLSIVYTPSNPPAQWIDHSIQEQLRVIPGIQVVKDIDGVLAREFGAYTSGWTILYNRDGQCLYSGGITPQRGHEGDNPGSQAILHYLEHPNAPATQGRVFGCPIRENGSEEAKVQ